MQFNDSARNLLLDFARGAALQKGAIMDVNERIKKQLDTYPVLLYMKGTPDFPQCGFSAQAVAALKQVGAKFHAVDIFGDQELREELKRFSNWPRKRPSNSLKLDP